MTTRSSLRHYTMTVIAFANESCGQKCDWTLFYAGKGAFHADILACDIIFSYLCIMKNVVVVIPIYKKELGEYERISVSRTCKVLGAHDIVVVHPEGLDIRIISKMYPELKFHSFHSRFFKGIMGYNRLMMSEEFYSAFETYEYILICQTDAYVFSDRLEEWCEAGYDYVGAPWLRKPVYNLPIIRQWVALSTWISHKKGQRSRRDLYGKVGNGGLSLRRVASHLDVLRKESEKIAPYVNRSEKCHLYNEDVFWAVEPDSFKYPSVEDALRFSFDKYPSLAFKLTNGELPMGCHAWWKRKMRRFWLRTKPEMFP